MMDPRASSVDARLTRIEEQANRIEEQTDRLRQQTERLEQQTLRIEQESRSLRALIERTYERSLDASVLLMRLRRSSDYQDAYLDNPLVSVRMGAYEPGDLLVERSVPSILAQTYENWELIIVFDGPDASEVERVNALADPRIRCFARPRNGPYPTEPMARWQVAGSHPFNDAVARAAGAWIAPIDQDDEWTPNHLEDLISAARSTRAEVAYGSICAVVGDHGDTYFGDWPPAHGNFGFQAAVYHAGLSEFTYDANAHLLDLPADWHLARRMLDAGVRFEYVPEIVGKYYVRDEPAIMARWVATLNDRGPFTTDRE